MDDTLTALALIFSQLSVVAFGGGNTTLPEMHRQVVDVHHWMSNADFAALYALAQAAPGPNLMVAPLIGTDDYMFGWLSAHFAEGPRPFAAADIAALDQARRAVLAVPGMPLKI